jgi:hypothetical protein
LPISAAIAVTLLRHPVLLSARRASNSGGTQRHYAHFTTYRHAASAPVVSRTRRRRIAATSATLKGSIDPNGIATTGKFEFGTSAGNLNREESVIESIGTGTSAVPVSAPITDLLCGTQYFFRASANNASGTVTGATLSFNTTGLHRSAAIGSPATRPPPSRRPSATLNGTVDPNGFAATALFRYGTSSGNLNLTANVGPVGSGRRAGPDIRELVEPGLQHAVLLPAPAAPNSGGTVDGNILNFTTSNCAAVAATVTTTAADCDLGQRRDPQRQRGTPTHIRGHRRVPVRARVEPTRQRRSPRVGGCGNSGRADPDRDRRGWRANTQYFFRAYGTNAAGTTFGPTLSFNTSVCPFPAPAAVTGVASGVSPVGATLNGTVDPNGSATTVYSTSARRRARHDGLRTPCSTAPDPVPVTLPTSRLLCDTTYYFRVRAVSVGGVSNGST